MSPIESESDVRREWESMNQLTWYWIIQMQNSETVEKLKTESSLSAHYVGVFAKVGRWFQLSMAM